jgi:hypothetical protein
MRPEMTKLVEIRNNQEEVIWSLWLPAEHAKKFREKFKGNENPGNPERKEKGRNPGPGGSDDPMTYPQKRYLFRLLADRGLEGDAAYKHLKKDFGVDSLQQITKFDASQAIDQMLNN